jgi:hypothetical protein
MNHTRIAYSYRMKNITLSADEDLIKRARLTARAQRTTLNAAFREWLTRFAAGSGDEQYFDALMERMKHINSGQHFDRDELNER